MLHFCKSIIISEAHAHIHDTDGGDVMVKRGSNIELNCTVESGDRVHHSLAVFWYLDDSVIDWMGQTGPGSGVQVTFVCVESSIVIRDRSLINFNLHLLDLSLAQLKTFCLGFSLFSLWIQIHYKIFTSMPSERKHHLTFDSECIQRKE